MEPNDTVAIDALGSQDLASLKELALSTRTQTRQDQLARHAVESTARVDSVASPCLTLPSSSPDMIAMTGGSSPHRRGQEIQALRLLMRLGHHE